MDFNRLTVGEKSPPITKVVVHRMDGNKWEAGTEGRTLNVDCPFATAEMHMAEKILAQVQGYRYQPFTMEKTVIGPELKLGDVITEGSLQERVYQMNVSYKSKLVADLESPELKEIEHDYKFQTSTGRTAAAAKRTAKEAKKLAFEVDSGLRQVATQDENGNWALAEAKVYATIKDSGNGAFKQAFLDIKVVAEDGKMYSFAEIMADTITLHGKTDVIGTLSVSEGSLQVAGAGLHVDGPASFGGTVNATGQIRATDINIFGGIYFNDGRTPYAPQKVAYLTPEGSGSYDFFFEGGTARGLTAHSSGGYLAFIQDGTLPAGGSWVYHNGSKTHTCYTGSPGRLTVTQPDGSQSQYAMDSGHWEIPTGIPTEDWFLVQQAASPAPDTDKEGQS